jgi:glycosyltransferase involved in cell wall biosynthesis
MPFVHQEDWRLLYEHYKDFGLHVVVNILNESDEFCHCKSELKYIEASALGVPLVTSRVHPFVEVIREGENGFLASTPREFALKTLSVCRDRALALDIVKSAQADQEENYNALRNARRFALDLLEKSGKKSESRRPSLKSPGVSVVMSTYNRNYGDESCSSLLRRAIDSILDQTFRDFELILIDDGSTDGSEKVCREYERRDNRVRFYRFEENSGIPARRYNEGMRLAKADYLMFMFDDDEWLPNAIRDLYGSITRENDDCSMVYGLVTMHNAKTGQTLKEFGAKWNVEALRSDNLLGNLSVIISREAVNSVGGYREEPEFRRTCDWELWMRIGRKFPVARMEKLVGKCYLSREGSIGQTVPLSGLDRSLLLTDLDEYPEPPLKGKMNRPIRLRLAHANADRALVRWALSYLNDGLKTDGIESQVVNVCESDGRSKCDESDVVMFYRTADQDSLDFFRQLKVQGKLMLYFIDDYLFRDGCEYASPEQSKIIRDFLSEADAVVSSNTLLLGKAPEKVRKIFRRTSIDEKTFRLLRPEGYVSSAPGCYAIGWLAGIGRNEMNDFVGKMLERLDGLLSNDEQVVFICFGNHGLGGFQKVRVSESRYFRPEAHRELYDAYRSYCFSVVVNPLNEQDEFFHCKSELKYIETGALTVPLVVSRVHPFTEIIREGENGFLASSPDEFAEKALFVCRNASVASRVARVANEHVMSEYNSVCNARAFMAELVVLLRDHERNEARRGQRREIVNQLGLLSATGPGVVGPLYGNQQVEMSVQLMPKCLVTSISVRGATYLATPRLSAYYSIWINGIRTREGGIPLSEMMDNHWWKMSFDPFMVKAGDTLTLRICNREHEVKVGFYESKNQFAGRCRLGAKPANPLALRIDTKEENL